MATESSIATESRPDAPAGKFDAFDISEVGTMFKEAKVKNVTDKKRFKLIIYLDGYLPTEVLLETVGNKVIVEARHTEMRGGVYGSHHFHYEHQLPAGIDPTGVTAIWNKEKSALVLEAFRPNGI